MIQGMNPTTGQRNFSRLQNIQTDSVLSSEQRGWAMKLTNHTSPSNAEVGGSYTHTYMSSSPQQEQFHLYLPIWSVFNLLWHEKIAVELTKLLQQFGHHYIARLIVICNNPVYVRYMHQRLAQSCQLCCLFPPGISWCNKIDFWKAYEVLTSGVLVQKQTHQITYSLNCLQWRKL
jgi:hypothetical protein